MEEEIDIRLGERIEQLGERWEWVRDRLGQEEWGRLVALRKTWTRLQVVRNAALAITLFYIALVALEVSVRKTPFWTAVSWHPIQLAPFVALLSEVGIWVVNHVARHKLSRLEWQGHNAEVLVQALWSEQLAEGLGQARAAGAEAGREGGAGPGLKRSIVRLPFGGWNSPGHTCCCGLRSPSWSPRWPGRRYQKMWARWRWEQ